MTKNKKIVTFTLAAATMLGMGAGVIYSSGPHHAPQTYTHTANDSTEAENTAQSKEIQEETSTKEENKNQKEATTETIENYEPIQNMNPCVYEIGRAHV